MAKKKAKSKSTHVENTDNSENNGPKMTSTVCERCGAIVNLGYSGDRNLENHQKGEACKKTVREKAIIGKSNGLADWLAKATLQLTKKKDAPSAVRPIPLLSSEIIDLASISDDAAAPGTSNTISKASCSGSSFTESTSSDARECQMPTGSLIEH